MTESGKKKMNAASDRLQDEARNQKSWSDHGEKEVTSFSFSKIKNQVQLWLRATCCARWQSMWVTSLLVALTAAILFGAILPAIYRCESCAQPPGGTVGAESVVWANILINRWLVFSSRSLFLKAKETLDPILEEAKPFYFSRVVLEHMRMRKSPEVSNVRVFDLVGGLREEVAHDLSSSESHQLVADGDLQLCDFHATLRYSFKYLPWLEFDVHIEVTSVTGRLRVTTTLGRDGGATGFPHLTQVSASFREMPKFEYKVTVLQIVPLHWFNAIINKLLTERLEKEMVAPMKINLFSQNSTGL